MVLLLHCCLVLWWVLLPLSTQPEFVSVSSSEVLTSEERAYLASKGRLLMSVDPGWMPFEALDKHQRHIGLVADMLALMQQRGGLDIQLVVTESWPRTLELMRNREIDVISVAAETPERLKFMNFTEPYYEVQSVIATLVNQPFLNDIKEIIHHPIGIIKGYSHVELLRSGYPGINIVEIDNYEQGLLKLQSGELYGVVGNMATISYSIQMMKMKNIKIAGNVPGLVRLSVATRSDEPMLNAIFNKLIHTISEEEKQEILNRWLAIKYEHSTDYSMLIHVMLIVLAVSVLVGFWMYKMRQLNSRLRLVNQQLEELNTQKNYFFSVIAHDLRNPFMGIVGFSDVLNSDAEYMEKEELKKISGIIHNKSNEVMGMLNQLLEWVRLEMNQVDKRPEAVDLHALTNELVALYELPAKAKGVELENQVPVALIKNLDKHMISTILRNLISNAIKYSFKGNTVVIGYSNSEKDELWVRDEGMGMDERTKNELFALKIGKSRLGTAKEVGTGLGLTICKRFAYLLGATLSVQSEPNKGSTFTVSLPSYHSSVRIS